MKTVKAIYTKTYQIELVETDNKYNILYVSANRGASAAQGVTDLNTALTLFDIMLEDLQGN